MDMEQRITELEHRTAELEKAHAVTYSTVTTKLDTLIARFDDFIGYGANRCTDHKNAIQALADRVCMLEGVGKTILVAILLAVIAAVLKLVLK